MLPDKNGSSPAWLGWRSVSRGSSSRSAGAGQDTKRSHRAGKGKLMRVFLRDARNGKYLGKDWGWTEKQGDAYDFESGDEAIKAWSLRREESVEMIYSFGGHKLDLSIPLAAPSGMPESRLHGRHDQVE